MNKFLNRIGRHPELFILLLVVVIITMLVIPLPTVLVDFLIGMNIILSALVFLSSFYIDRILSFSTFPSVLLITTLFRLALSVSTSRLVLNDADAGEIIATFGQFVIGDNLVVGFVIFAIVTIVQFMVITKGAERVAEVAARFSLDGMPGKQMSIDADVRAGSLDADAAKERRSVLERESQLYGSFDGAMKFIKGDAIAGIIIIFINLIGGISVGVSQHGMDVSTALSTYTMLTIGDGLVAQIPALLIAIGAGFIVTRVNGDGDNMGRTIVEQLLGNPTVLIISAIIALGIGGLPGFPFFTFLLLALMLISIYAHKQWQKRKNDPEHLAKKEQTKEHIEGSGDNLTQGLIENVEAVVAETIPLMLLVPASCQPMLKNSQLAERLKSQFYIDYGISLPDIIIQYSESIADNCITLLVNEIKADHFYIYFPGYRVISDVSELPGLGINTIDIEGAVWVEHDVNKSLLEMGFETRKAVDEVYLCMASILVRFVNEYFGVQETKSMLDKLEEKYPDLMKEVTRHATVQRISEVLQRLLSERISVRNLRMIMEALAQWAPREKDVISLVEHVRGAMARYICHKFSYGNKLNVIMLSHEFEEQVRSGVRSTSSGAFLNLEPAVVDELMDRFSLGLEDISIANKDMVVLSSVDIRRFLKKLIESRFKDLDVLSFSELTESVSINVVKTI
ncbi:EscV/YscV/HrcV family type III secretion system export apparatus protein [Serratia silvae]|uniref:EscV/YscV/HrcV family type III secretion system export apparatus protein n=1 Tax=Serratia silvae TaxID=2824122 RepID=A0ABT0KBA3_9GAMM|nr:EscV/YscV/HrcV family type III secretion system export apparatus protein [Serratia silvae]MCL1028798.1 EscV/YscV/HrcV family type III secretion system export apparatus protein [Serratia silvae]